MSKQTIGVVVGSLRTQSFSGRVANYLASSLDGFDVKFLAISDLPLYNEELEADVPPAWRRFRQDLGQVDAVLFVTPEYNRSIPAALKNAMDVGSRPYGASGWDGKPGAVVSVSPGAIGGFGANHHLRQVATFLNIAMMQQPEAYVGGVAAAVDEATVTDPKVTGFLDQFAKAFTNWINRLS